MKNTNLTMNAIIEVLTANNELTTRELASALNKDTSTILKFIKKNNNDNVVSVTQTVTGNKYSVTEQIKFEDVFNMYGKKVVSNYNMIRNLRELAKSATDEAARIVKVLNAEQPFVYESSLRYINRKDNVVLDGLLNQ